MSKENNNKVIKSEVENFAEFNLIRYAQVWEDADILVGALDINSKDKILSIASAGENAMALLTKSPNAVYAIDLNFEQIACCEFKKAAYKLLDYNECMQLIGVFKCEDRLELYKKIEDELSKEVKEFFDANKNYIEDGIINVGKFEKYLKSFGNKVLPMVHTKRTRQELLAKKTKEERIKFYDKRWNNARWRMLFRIFFSRFVMGRLGRDKAFFRYVKGNVADRILEHTKYAITELDTSKNSYLHYIINGEYSDVLPVAYREENFEIIKKNIDKLVLMTETVETFLAREDIDYISKYNLSDIFEYMDDSQMCKIIESIFTKSKKGSRIAYWNMLAEKRASKYFDNLKYLELESKKLYKKDKAFFYSDFIIEEIV